MKERRQMCPVCGNEISPPWRVSVFKCRFCQRWIEVFVENNKGKKVVRLEEKM